MNYSKIIGTGSYLPKKILTNFDLEKFVETSNDWIVELSVLGFINVMWLKKMNQQ